MAPHSSTARAGPAWRRFRSVCVEAQDWSFFTSTFRWEVCTMVIQLGTRVCWYSSMFKTRFGRFTRPGWNGSVYRSPADLADLALGEPNERSRTPEPHHRPFRIDTRYEIHQIFDRFWHRCHEPVQRCALQWSIHSKVMSADMPPSSFSPGSPNSVHRPRLADR